MGGRRTRFWIASIGQDSVVAGLGTGPKVDCERELLSTLHEARGPVEVRHVHLRSVPRGEAPELAVAAQRGAPRDLTLGSADGADRGGLASRLQPELARVLHRRLRDVGHHARQPTVERKLERLRGIHTIGGDDALERGRLCRGEAVCSGRDAVGGRHVSQNGEHEERGRSRRHLSPTDSSATATARGVAPPRRISGDLRKVRSSVNTPGL